MAVTEWTADDAEHEARFQKKVGVIKAALASVPDDLNVRKNQVGNWSFMDDEGNYVGYFDPHKPEAVLFDDQAG